MLGLTKKVRKGYQQKTAHDVVEELFECCFCGNPVFRDNVIHTLYGSFPQSVIDLIYWRYEQMMAHVFTPHQNWLPSPFPNTAVLRTRDVLFEVDNSYFSSVPSMNRLWQYQNIGHDLPVWLDRPLDDTYPQYPCDCFDSNKKRVMIVAQDPLRSNRKAGAITISSVFGMHSKDWRGNRITTQIFNELLRNDCCLYLTDFNKLFIESRETSLSHVNAFKNKFLTMLDQEIVLFKPDLIVTWGKQASGQLINGSFQSFPPRTTPYKYKGVKVLPVYHTNFPMSKNYIARKGAKSKVDLYVQEILKA